MAAASTTNRRTHPRSGRRRNLPFRPADLEEVAAALQAVRDREGKRTLYRNALESRDRLYRALVRRAIADGSRSVMTTITQLGAAAGYKRSGDRRDDEQRWGNSIRRALVDLQAAGLIQWSGVKRPNGAWRCIEVGMPEQPQAQDGSGSVSSSGLTYPPLSCVGSERRT